MFIILPAKRILLFYHWKMTSHWDSRHAVHCSRAMTALSVQNDLKEESDAVHSVKNKMITKR